MLPRHHPGRVQITFDGRQAANAGLILPAPSPCAWACPNYSGSASAWAMRRAGPTPATS